MTRGRSTANPADRSPVIRVSGFPGFGRARNAVLGRTAPPGLAGTSGQTKAW
jgi:hypothetical protein